MPDIAALIFSALYIILVVGLLWTGISGLLGRAIWLPYKGNTGLGVTVTGRLARVTGLLLLLLAALFIYLPAREFTRP